MTYALGISVLFEIQCGPVGLPFRLALEMGGRSNCIERR